jgi:hypothetical protein
MKLMTDIQKTRDTNLIVDTLISTAKFSAAFTLSRGYRGDEGPYPGSAILTRKAAFQAFVIVGTIAMVHPSSAVFLHFSLTVMEDPTQGIWKIAFAAALTFLAMSAMMVAFLPYNEKTTACALDHHPVCLNFFFN